MPDYSETTDYLYSLRNRGSNYGIDRMQQFATALGSPQRRFPVIHVAGTNGKGSLCAMLEALYRKNGYKTGFFCSPHLLHLGERIQVNRCPLTSDAIVDYTTRLRPVAERIAGADPDKHPTFFEFMAAMAFLHFAEEGVDIACIETGLGGRLDATNIVTPELSIITTISLDHTELLGNSLAEIAREKAGILKSGKPALLGYLPEEAECVVQDLAEQRDCPVHSVRQHYPLHKTLPPTNLPGSFQRRNAALAHCAVEILAETFPLRSSEALQQINWPGRWQCIPLSGKTLILDATHNPEGCSQLAENLASLKEKPIILAGTLGEERGRSLMQTIAPFARELYLVKPDQPRAIEDTALKSYLPEGSAFSVHRGKLDAIFPGGENCALGSPGDTIVCTGSIYLIGEILQRLKGCISETPGNFQDKPETRSEQPD